MTEMITAIPAIFDPLLLRLDQVIACSYATLKV